MLRLKLWEATVKAEMSLLGRKVEALGKVQVIADTFERAAVLALDAAIAEATENGKEISNLELNALQSMGPAWSTEIDVITPIGSPRGN